MHAGQARTVGRAQTRDFLSRGRRDATDLARVRASPPSAQSPQLHFAQADHDPWIVEERKEEAFEHRSSTYGECGAVTCFPRSSSQLTTPS